MGGKAWGNWAIFSCLPRCVSIDQDWKQSSQDLNVWMPALASHATLQCQPQKQVVKFLTITVLLYMCNYIALAWKSKPKITHLAHIICVAFSSFISISVLRKSLLPSQLNILYLFKTIEYWRKLELRIVCLYPESCVFIFLKSQWTCAISF